MSGDPYFASNSLLLLCNGTNGSTTIIDSSPFNHTITPVGNAQLTTTSPKYGSACLTLDGTGDWLTTPNHADAFRFPGLFTWDWWLKGTKTGLYTPIAVNRSDDGTPGIAITLFNYSLADKMSLFSPSGWISDAACVGVNDGNWHHHAITRDGSNATRYYFDGVHQKSSTTFVGAVGFVNIGLIIGVQNGQTSRTVQGQMDCIRATKGVARWTGTGSFTPPQSEAAYLPDRRVILIQ